MLVQQVLPQAKKKKTIEDFVAKGFNVKKRTRTTSRPVIVRQEPARFVVPRQPLEGSIDVSKTQTGRD